MTTHLATHSLLAVAVAVLVTACTGTETPTNPADTGGASPGAGGAAGVSTGGSAGRSTGGTSPSGGSGGGCQKGQVKANEVLFIGDSFIALNRSIPTALQTLARNAGALGQSETYRDNSVSGTTLQGTGQIPSQYANGVNSGAVKVVLMDGGGNDCLQRNDAQGAVAPATSLFQSMAQNNTQYVVYFFYPDPQNNATLKTCIDTLRPLMQSLCESLATPKCHFIDLRPVFAGHYSEYILSDGIHPTAQGGSAVAQAVWDVMQKNCIAQ
jgi:lysophospholipase L1-like esterase